MASPTRTGRLLERAATVIPGGVSSNVRLGAPRRFFAGGRGARLWDVDGKEYVDYLLGQGPAFLGHAHPVVTAAVTGAVAKGMVYGAQHALEVIAAEKFIDAVGWAEQVRFGGSGTEAVQAAIRLARAVTGRRMVLRFSGSYHGWLDNVLLDYGQQPPGPASAGQHADYLQEWLVFPFNDTATLIAAFADHGAELAAVILEPVMCNNGVILPDEGFLEQLRGLCTSAGVVLIFDEVITGFRLAPGGAAERFGVVPDLGVYGKALAGGWPVAAVAGKAEIMSAFGRGTVNHSGTFNASVMATAAVSATLDVLAEDPPYERVRRHGTQLMAALADLGARHGIPLHVQGLPSAFHVGIERDAADTRPIRSFGDLQRLDLDRYARLSHDLADEGLWVAGRGVWYVSGAHTDEEAEVALRALGNVLARQL